MEFLLKIVEGAAKGAEVALVGGMRLKLGRGSDCDIVLNDASLAETACELDVGESAVTMLVPGAAPRELNQFEIYRLGEVAIAVGPADGEWQALRESAPAEEKPAVQETAAESEPDSVDAPVAEAASEEKRHSSILVWVALLVVLLALGICGFLAWQLGYADLLIEKACPSLVRLDADQSCPVDTAARLTFADVIRAHGLELVENDDGVLVRGNLKRRTERLAIRALALSENSRTRFDLTDDETLASCAEALLYVVTENCVKPAVATNRVLELTGYVPSVEASEAVTSALLADVPGVKDIFWNGVVFGGVAPVAVAETKFAKTGEIAKAEPSQIVQPIVVPVSEKSASAVPARKRFSLPYAGVIVKPYPCVVLMNGLRLVEGASVGGVEIVSIDEEKVVVRENGKLVERWL